MRVKSFKVKPEKNERSLYLDQGRIEDRKEREKFVLVSDWDPRHPDISHILRGNKDTLYRDPLNRRLFPDGSVIAGFRRRRNLGEIICPTKQQRQLQK